MGIKKSFSFWSPGIVGVFVSILNFINLQYVVFLRKHKAIAVLNYAGADFYNHLASQFLQSFIYSLLSAMTGIFIFESLHSSFNILLGKSPDAGHELIHTTYGSLCR